MANEDTIAESASNPPGWDAGLTERLRGLSADTAAIPAETIDRMYGDVRKDCDAEDAKWTGRLRSRSTTTRRLILAAVFGALTIVVIRLFPMIEPAKRTGAFWVTLALYAGLIGTCLWAATRPLHVPALSPRAVGTIIFLILGACVGTAFLPYMPEIEVAGGMFGSCMGMGLLLGLPVYGLVRLFDRGNNFGALMAAAAGGLAGNFMLKAHCPVDTTMHVLLEHASVAFIFVIGLLVIHRLLPAK